MMKKKAHKKLRDLQKIRIELIRDEFEIMHHLVEEACDYKEARLNADPQRNVSFEPRYSLRDPYLFDEDEEDLL